MLTDLAESQLKRSKILLMSNGEEPPLKRRRMTTFGFLMLPDDLVLNCLARVSRMYYPMLSLVSKRFRSFLTSAELYQTRNLLCRTENILYVCLRFFNVSNHPLRMFTLCRRQKSSRNVLVPILYPDSLPEHLPGVALVGSNIYVIGSLIKNNASSSVMVMDCRSHTWREAVSMRAERVNPSACVLDGKIYVAGGCTDLDATNWMEVFDPKTQTWEFVSSPGEEVCREFSSCESIGYDGNVYVESMRTYGLYELHKGRWREGQSSLARGGNLSSRCVIDNVLYRSRSWGIDWYDSEAKLWRELKGLENLFGIRTYGRTTKCVNYGGKIAFFWLEKVGYNKRYQKTNIWSAEITIERREKGEIWGTLEWFDVVFTTNEERVNLTHVFAATL
ncbi:PREDICTED: putative F-box/kelch-repeat protein At3g43710 [Camelina sativa]|uniref:F-box/kelch-repeat protein At3g43710 n=1 Tax=Camelina sativa TaxID=90675 RepID=A0ABM1QKL2_CAMSA|nr:PREDICTED: putative F-box/kelch-repeat protein At3g43710 [Camelina sativa]